jgi:glycogen(starch) synthase
VRYRLVTEASEHVLRFDWSDAGRRTAAVYGALGRPRPRPRAVRRPAMPQP